MVREISHEHLKPTATWGTHSMQAPLVSWCPDTKREGASMRQRKGEREATKTVQAPLCRALQFSSGMVSPHQHQSIISTSCWDRKVRWSFEWSHSSGSSWSHARYTHTHTRVGCESLEHDCSDLKHHFICQVVFIRRTKGILSLRKPFNPLHVAFKDIFCSFPDSPYWLPCFGWPSRRRNLLDPSSWSQV